MKGAAGAAAGGVCCALAAVAASKAAAIAIVIFFIAVSLKRLTNTCIHLSLGWSLSDPAALGRWVTRSLPFQPLQFREGLIGRALALLAGCAHLVELSGQEDHQILAAA